MRGLGLAAIGLAAGCAGEVTVAPAPVLIPAPLVVAGPSEPKAPPASLLEGDGEQAVTLAWRRVAPTTGCFFFSGPEDLGRDVHLGRQARWRREGGEVKLAFDRGPTFQGTANGGRLALRREASYEFEGQWKVTETITGEVSAGSLRARYRYEECQLPDGDCPGSCTIEAELAVERAPFRH